MFVLQTMRAAAALSCLLATAAAAQQHFSVWNPAQSGPATSPFRFSGLQSQLATTFAEAETGNFLAGFSPEGDNFLDADIVKKTREATENTKSLLTSLKNNRIYAPLVVKALERSNCLANIEDAIAAVDASARLGGGYRPNLPGTAGRAGHPGADPQLGRHAAPPGDDPAAPAALNKDYATPTAGRAGQLSDLDSLLHQFSAFIPAGNNIRPACFSALISQTQAFLAKVNRSTARLQDSRLCARGDFQNTIFATVERILTDLSEFMRSVNPGQSTINQRQTAAFQQKFRQMFRQVASSTAGLQQRCTGNTDTSSAPISTLAAALDDLAAIIEDVGVETLSR